MYQDDEKLEMLEHGLKEATEAANEAEKKYDEVCLATVSMLWLLGGMTSSHH